MKPISPVIEAYKDREIVLAKDQPEYTPLPALVGGAPLYSVVLTRWQFTPEEREAVKKGEDLFLTTLTFGHPFQPVTLTVGEPNPGIQYDNRKDLFDEACGDVVRAWAIALTSVSSLASDANMARAMLTRHLLAALHALVGSTMTEEANGEKTKSSIIL